MFCLWFPLPCCVPLYPAGATARREMVTAPVTDQGGAGAGDYFIRCGTAGRKKGVITLHLGATGNEFPHKGLDLLCIIYASINFPSWLYWLCKFSHLWARPWFSTSAYSLRGGAPQGTTNIKQAAGFDGARSHLPFLLDYIPGTAVSSGSHLVTVMHEGVWNQIDKRERGTGGSLGGSFGETEKPPSGGKQMALQFTEFLLY